MMPIIFHKASLVISCQLPWEKTYSKHVGPMRKVVCCPSQTFKHFVLSSFASILESSRTQVLCSYYLTSEKLLTFLLTLPRTRLEYRQHWFGKNGWLGPSENGTRMLLQAIFRLWVWTMKALIDIRVIYPFRKQRHRVSLNISEALELFCKNTRSVSCRGGRLSQILRLSQPGRFPTFPAASLFL